MTFIVAEQELFGRKWRVQIRDLVVTEFRCVFKVSKTLAKRPNRCDLTIYNLEKSHRAEIEGFPKRRVNLEPLETILRQRRPPNFVSISAGYESGLNQIYFGEVLDGHSIPDGPNYKTVISSADGERDTVQRRINIPIGAGTPPSHAIQQMATALGVGVGNLDLSGVKNLLDTGRLSKIYETGTVLTGCVWDELQSLAKSADLEISIQDGKLLVLKRGAALPKTAYLLNKKSGLVGSPAVDAKGVVTFRTLMLPDLYPGVPVILESRGLKGNYRVTECEYNGDTHGSDWFVDVKAKLY